MLSTVLTNGPHSVTIREARPVNIAILVSQNEDWTGKGCLKYNQTLLYPYICKDHNCTNRKITYYVSPLQHIVVVKHIKDELDLFIEQRTMKIVLDMTSPCQDNIIKMLRLGPSHLVMEHYDGSVDELLSDDLNVYREDIIDSLMSSLVCLRDKGLYHTDLKLNQLLYRVKSDVLEIVLTDLSTVKIGQRGGAPTYPSPTYNHKGIVNESDIEWAIMCTILSTYVDTRKIISRFCGSIVPPGVTYEWSLGTRIKLLQVVEDMIDGIDSGSYKDVMYDILDAHRSNPVQVLGILG